MANLIKIITFLKTFKYELVNCKPSKNKFLSIKIFIVRTILCATYTTIITTKTTCLLFLLAYNLFTAILVRQICIAKIFKPRLLYLHDTLHKADYILTGCCQLCLALYAHAKIEFSCSRSLENSIATTQLLLPVYNVRSLTLGLRYSSLSYSY